ncbi:septation protein SepH [Nocardiopsis oceani]
MHELRLVAVSEDGTYLVLASTGRGTRFMLPVDDRLRAAVRGQFSRLGQYEIEVENPLRPKEIQARIRSGETAEAISEISGIPIERVRWFEGPVLQEREYIAQQAQRATVRSHGDAAPGPSLEEVVGKRIGAHQIETGDAVWDSWKREDRSWLLKLVFLHGGDERVAHWLYEPRHNSVTPADEEAVRFSSNEPLDTSPGLGIGPGANVTPFAPRRNETTTDLPRLDAQSAAERRPDHVAPRRLSPAQDTPTDDPLRPVARQPETDQFGVPLRGERHHQPQNQEPAQQGPPHQEPSQRRPVEPRPVRHTERHAEQYEAPPAAPLPTAPRREAPRAEPPSAEPVRRQFSEPAEPSPARPEPRQRPQMPGHEPAATREAPVEHAETRHRAEPPTAPDWLDAQPAPAAPPEPEEAPPTDESAQQRPRRRRATIDLNDKGTPRRTADEQPPNSSIPAAANGSSGGGTAKRKGRGRRASVPSWDEIMFGSKKSE